MQRDELVERLEAIQRAPYSVIQKIGELSEILTCAVDHITQQDAELTRLRAQVPEGMAALVSEIAGQVPEKPDHWNFCSQCERNIERAQELLSAAPTPQKGVES